MEWCGKTTIPSITLSFKGGKRAIGLPTDISGEGRGGSEWFIIFDP